MSTTTTIRDIKDEIGATYERMKATVAAAQAEGKPLQGEREETYKRDEARLSDLIKMRDQHYAMLDAQAAAVDARAQHISTTVRAAGGNSRDEKRLTSMADSDQYREAFVSYLRGGFGALTEQQQRALSETANADGGFLPTTEFYATLVEKRFLANAMRSAADVMAMGSFKTDIPIENAFATAAYVAQGNPATETSPTFANVVLSPNTLRVFTKASNELIADAPTRGPGFNIETILASQMGRVMGKVEELAFASGSGSGEPKGIFTYGSGATPDVTNVETAASGAVAVADLLNVVYALPRQYRANAKWVMTDSVFNKIRQLLMTAGTAAGSHLTYAPFAWSLGDGRLQDGEPDRLLGFPVVCLADGPAFAAGSRVAAFGDMSYYKIGERESINIKVARETFLANNQTGYFGFARHDGKLTVAESQVQLKIKA
jgi:HK97 family phage major capsid protein